MLWNLIFADGMIYRESRLRMSWLERKWQRKWGISLPCEAMAQSQVCFSHHLPHVEKFSVMSALS